MQTMAENQRSMLQGLVMAPQLGHGQRMPKAMGALGMLEDRSPTEAPWITPPRKRLQLEPPATPHESGSQCDGSPVEAAPPASPPTVDPRSAIVVVASDLPAQKSQADVDDMLDMMAGRAKDKAANKSGVKAATTTALAVVQSDVVVRAAATQKANSSAAAMPSTKSAAIGKGAKSSAKAKATAPKVVATSKAKAKADASDKTKKHVGLILGCSKCRFKVVGCGQCRNPDFGGLRWNPEV